MSEEREKTEGGAELSFGQQRVGVSFNPSRLPAVDQIKQKTAELIDLLQAVYSITLASRVRFF